MNRSFFSASPFRPSYGIQPLLERRRTLGQDLLEDIFGEGTEEDVEGLLGGLESLIGKLPVGIAGPFTKRRDECLAKSNMFEKYKCLYDLFQDVKKAVKDEEERPTTPTTPPKPPAKDGGFPIVPVAIGAIAVAAIAFALFKSK